MIFLLDGSGKEVGPFANREAVERFIQMMALCGENWAGRKMVDGGGGDVPGRDPAQADSSVDGLKSTNKLKLVGRRP